MLNAEKAAQEVGTDGVFNRDTPAKGPRPTARGKERIQRGEDFMPEWTIARMDEYRKGLKDGKEKTVLLACIKRKEYKTIARIAKEMRRKPDTVRGWLARGRERGLYDLADHAPPGRVPILDRAMRRPYAGGCPDPPPISGTRGRGGNAAWCGSGYARS